MKYTIEKNDQYVVIELQEQKLNTVNSPEFKNELVLLHNNGIPSFILSLRSVEMIDSSGLSALLMANRLCTSLGGLLLLCDINPSVDKMLKIAHLNEVLQIEASLEEAVNKVVAHHAQQQYAPSSGDNGQTPVNMRRRSDEESRLEEDPDRLE
jgi:anti-anti-sigma factor